MIVNRYILKHSGLIEKDIQRVQAILLKSTVRKFDKMVLSDRNYLVATTHFDLIEFAEYQRERIINIRSISVKPNLELLKKIEAVITKVI